LEGKAKIVTKKITQKDPQTTIEEQVFYNPVQIFNRDITVLAISTFAKQQDHKINILDALSASGLRSIRFAQEIESNLVDKIYANDLSTASLSLIKENVEANDID
jgi:tRNA (guanine26-N2/guanine27-N2)-dimethyltransferase